jgi:hypothetical protein
MCVNIGMWSFHHNIASSKVVSEWWIQVDEFKLGINSTKSNIYHSKMVKLFILVFNFLHRPFMEMDRVCSFHHHVIKMVWSLVLYVILWIQCVFFSHLLIDYDYFHSWPFSSSHMICSSYILMFFTTTMVLWFCGSRTRWKIHD